MSSALPAGIVKPPTKSRFGRKMMETIGARNVIRSRLIIASRDKLSVYMDNLAILKTALVNYHCKMNAFHHAKVDAFTTISNLAVNPPQNQSTSNNSSPSNTPGQSPLAYIDTLRALPKSIRYYFQNPNQPTDIPPLR